MTDYRYVTIDGQPPCNGAAPGLVPPPGSAPTGNSGGYLGSGVIAVYPRPDVGSNPDWQPWHNVPGLPTAVAVAASSPPATNAPSPSGSRPPTADRPLRLPSGMGYIFPKSHTTIHVIEPGYLPWERPRGAFKWRAYVVPTSISLGEFINQICELSNDQKRQGKTMADASWQRIVECVELGEGLWGRGSEYYTGEGKSSDENMKRVVGLSLEKLGWDSKHGNGSPPIWVATQVILK
ncbi:hypothetical protein FQN54_009393 [Arachnomyces sp. PD_36]|nr:hypothetical protein FQN54_009393 [Arachnomyces sp. PD_36]